MSTGLYSHTTRATGIILTAAIYNADHVNHITNLNPTMSGALSDSLAEHQSLQDPGDLGAEVLGTNLADELKQLRFCIRRITGKAQWYIPPATDLQSVGGTITHLVVTQDAAFQGDLTPAQIIANQANYAPTGHASAFRFLLSSDASRDITGLAGGASGRVVVLVNAGSFPINLKNQDASSSAANRFAFASDATLFPNYAMVLSYDSVASRWRPCSTSTYNNLQIGGNFTMAGDLSGLVNLLQSGYAELSEIAAPANPAADKIRLYCKDVSTVSRLAYRDSAGVETLLTGGSGVRGYAEVGGSTVITSIPLDNTIPQNTEGTEILSVSLPALANASNRVRVRFETDWGATYTTGTTGDHTLIAALFKDSGADALASVAKGHTQNDITSAHQISLTYEFAPGSAAAATYKIRVGPANGQTSGRTYTVIPSIFGATHKAKLIVEEVVV